MLALAFSMLCIGSRPFFSCCPFFLQSDVPIHPHGNKGRDRSSGIPSAFLVPAANANEPGSFVNRDGKLVVSILER